MEMGLSDKRDSGCKLIVHFVTILQGHLQLRGKHLEQPNSAFLENLQDFGWFDLFISKVVSFIDPSFHDSISWFVVYL